MTRSLLKLIESVGKPYLVEYPSSLVSLNDIHWSAYMQIQQGKLDAARATLEKAWEQNQGEPITPLLFAVCFERDKNIQKSLLRLTYACAKGFKDFVWAESLLPATVKQQKYATLKLVVQKGSMSGGFLWQDLDLLHRLRGMSLGEAAEALQAALKDKLREFGESRGLGEKSDLTSVQLGQLESLWQDHRTLGELTYVHTRLHLPGAKISNVGSPGGWFSSVSTEKKYQISTVTREGRTYSLTIYTDSPLAPKLNTGTRIDVDGEVIEAEYSTTARNLADAIIGGFVDKDFAYYKRMYGTLGRVELHVAGTIKPSR